MKTYTLETKRLILRQWTDDDLLPFYKLNSNKRVMEFFPKSLSQSESDNLAKRIKNLITENGFGFWAVELKETKSFIGFIGINQPQNLPFSPCYEIGWRLDFKYWNNGYATEGANEILRFCFKELDIKEIVSFTAKINKRSQSVMKKLNMVDTQRNFLHPDIPKNLPISEHVLYKISKLQWSLHSFNKGKKTDL